MQEGNPRNEDAERCTTTSACAMMKVGQEEEMGKEMEMEEEEGTHRVCVETSPTQFDDEHRLEHETMGRRVFDEAYRRVSQAVGARASQHEGRA